MRLKFHLSNPLLRGFYSRLLGERGWEGEVHLTHVLKDKKEAPVGASLMDSKLLPRSYVYATAI
jgi:hypothetical protein